MNVDVGAAVLVGSGVSVGVSVLVAVLVGLAVAVGGIGVAVGRSVFVAVGAGRGVSVGIGVAVWADDERRDISRQRQAHAQRCPARARADIIAFSCAYLEKVAAPGTAAVNAEFGAFERFSLIVNVGVWLENGAGPLRDVSAHVVCVIEALAGLKLGNRRCKVVAIIILLIARCICTSGIAVVCAPWVPLISPRVSRNPLPPLPPSPTRPRSASGLRDLFGWIASAHRRPLHTS